MVMGATNSNSVGLVLYMYVMYWSQKNVQQQFLDLSAIFQIVHRYDIILIQEVRDSDLSATKKIMEHVNKYA